MYNRKMVSSVTKMTPAEAEKKENWSQVRMNTLTQTKHNKAYPPVNVGDRVRLFRRRKHLSEKEEVPSGRRSPTKWLRSKITQTQGNCTI